MRPIGLAALSVPGNTVLCNLAFGTTTSYSICSSRIGLRLDLYPPSQVLQINGRLCHLVPTSRFVGGITNSRAPLLPRHYPGSSLLRTHPPPSRLQPISQCCWLLGLPFSSDFSLGRGGLLQLLSVSLSPCCRYHPAGVGQPSMPAFRCPCCLRPTVAGSAPGVSHFRGHLCVHFRYGLVTRCHPSDDIVDRLQNFGFPPPCYPSYGAPGFYPGRSVSC